jgi:hypothetical protein
VWTLPAGATIVAGAGTNTITVDFSPTASSGSVSVHGVNTSCGIGLESPFLNITTISPSLPSITGGTSVCVGSTSIFSTAAGNSNYLWNVTGGTFTGTGNSISVTWNTTGPQSITVGYTISGLCNVQIPTPFMVTVNPLPVPVITGPASACIGSTGNVYTTETGMTTYNWLVSAGGSVTSGLGTNSITVTWNSAGAQNVSVIYTNADGCTAAPATAYPVTVHPLPSPTVSGPSPVCAASTGNIYTTESGKSGYIWTVSAGGLITAGAGTDAATVTWNTSGAQTVGVIYTDGNGCTANPATTHNVTVNPLPVPVITGDAAPCLNSTKVYSTAVGMSGYQ